MAKEKAQGKETEMTKTLSEEQLAEISADLNEEDSKMLVPVLRQLPAEVALRFTELVASMSSNRPGLEEMTTSWMPALVKVRQPVSTDAPKTLQMGAFYTELGEVLPTPFRFVPLYMYPGNMKFAEGDVSPSCRSEDTITSIYGSKCKDCNEEPWKHGEPTDCNKYRFVLVLNPDTWKLYRLQFGKTSYKTGSKLEKWMRGTPKCTWSKAYNLVSKEVERKGGGVYYVFEVEMTNENIVDQNLLDLGFFLHGKIKEARQSLLASLQNVQQVAGEKAKQIVERTEADFIAPSKAAEPDFSTGSTL